MFNTSIQRQIYMQQKVKKNWIVFSCSFIGAKKQNEHTEMENKLYERSIVDSNIVQARSIYIGS